MPLIRFRKEKGKLVFSSPEDENFYKLFKDLLQENDLAEAHFDIINADKSLGQLNKVHKVIREIALSTGNDFEDVKKEVKRKAGFSYTDDQGNEHFKSFADCSKDEMSLAILVAEDISVDMGIPVI